jgi:hypothetical protein
LRGIATGALCSAVNPAWLQVHLCITGARFRAVIPVSICGMSWLVV